MKIGTVRKEEARVFDNEAGFHQFENEEGERFGSFEVLWIEETQDDYGGVNSPDALPFGWYWQACFPGCLPDGPLNGPFSTSSRAKDDALDY